MASSKRCRSGRSGASLPREMTCLCRQRLLKLETCLSCGVGGRDDPATLCEVLRVPRLCVLAALARGVKPQPRDAQRALGICRIGSHGIPAVGREPLDGLRCRRVRPARRGRALHLLLEAARRLRDRHDLRLADRYRRGKGIAVQPEPA